MSEEIKNSIEESKKIEEKKDKSPQESEEKGSDELMDLLEEALEEPKDTSSNQEQPESSSQEKSKSETQPAKLEQLSPQKKGEVYPELEFILDIPLEVSVEIGRTKMLIRDLLKLNQGSIVELEKFAGEPVEIYVNGKLMAKGEVVVVNDKFGVRITEIISAQERIRKLGS